MTHTIFLIIGSIMTTISLSLCVYGIIRTILVGRFIKKVIDLDIEYDKKTKNLYKRFNQKEYLKLYYSLPHIYVMVFSFEKLIYENWISKKLIEERILNENENL